MSNYTIPVQRMNAAQVALHPFNVGNDGGPSWFGVKRAPVRHIECIPMAESSSTGSEKVVEASGSTSLKSSQSGYGSIQDNQSINNTNWSLGTKQTPVMQAQNQSSCSCPCFSVARRLVSRKKRRFIHGGFDLDLAYILNNVVAMGFPSVGVESIYRNPRKHLQDFLAIRYGRKFRIYNLCSEAPHQYDSAVFSDQVVCYPFDDHNPPPANYLFNCCNNMYQFLEKDPQNVALIHCKAGKGRTGQIICCYLLHSGACSVARESLELYGTRRTHNGQGVTIPSQRRYVYYYELQLRALRAFQNVPIKRCDENEKTASEKPSYSDIVSHNASPDPGLSHTPVIVSGNAQLEKNSASSQEQFIKESEECDDASAGSAHESIPASGMGAAKDLEQPHTSTEHTDTCATGESSTSHADDHEITVEKVGPWRKGDDPRKVPNVPCTITSISFTGTVYNAEALFIKVYQMDDSARSKLILDTSRGFNRMSSDLTQGVLRHNRSQSSQVASAMSEMKINDNSDEKFTNLEENTWSNITEMLSSIGQAVDPTQSISNEADQAHSPSANSTKESSKQSDTEDMLPCGPNLALIPSGPTVVPTHGTFKDCTVFASFNPDTSDKGIHVAGNFKVELWGYPELSGSAKPKRFCWFWLHTAFLPVHTTKEMWQGTEMGDNSARNVATDTSTTSAEDDNKKQSQTKTNDIAQETDDEDTLDNDQYKQPNTLNNANVHDKSSNGADNSTEDVSTTDKDDAIRAATTEQKDDNISAHTENEENEKGNSSTNEHTESVGQTAADTELNKKNDSSSEPQTAVNHSETIQNNAVKAISDNQDVSSTVTTAHTAETQAGASADTHTCTTPLQSMMGSGHVSLPKFEIDKAVGDKKHKKFSANFSVTVTYRIVNIR